MSVVKANLAQLYTEIGDASLLDHAPYDQIVTASQYYDPRAISFMIRFGYIVDKYSKRPQEIWVLFYPPTKEGRHPEMQFHSFDPDTNVFTKHDDSNISTTVSALASAFNNPKKAAKGKHVALAKYYYLKALVSREAGGASELEISIPITRTFVDSLRVVCREFEEAKERSSRSPSVTLVDDHDSVLSDPPEDFLEPTQPVKATSIITAEVSSVPVSTRKNKTIYSYIDTNVNRLMISTLSDSKPSLRSATTRASSKLPTVLWIQKRGRWNSGVASIKRSRPR